MSLLTLRCALSGAVIEPGDRILWVEAPDEYLSEKVKASNEFRIEMGWPTDKRTVPVLAIMGDIAKTSQSKSPHFRDRFDEWLDADLEPITKGEWVEFHEIRNHAVKSWK